MSVELNRGVLKPLTTATTYFRRHTVMIIEDVSGSPGRDRIIGDERSNVLEGFRNNDPSKAAAAPT